MKKWKIHYTLIKKHATVKDSMYAFYITEQQAIDGAMLGLFFELQSKKALTGVIKIEVDQIEEVPNV